MLRFSVASPTFIPIAHLSLPFDSQCISASLFVPLIYKLAPDLAIVKLPVTVASLAILAVPFTSNL